MDELKKLLAEAQTDEPWSVVWYGDEHLPAIAIHRTAEDRICFMPTIQHPADGVQFEANAALIVAAVNALPGLLEGVKRLEEALKFYADPNRWPNMPNPKNPHYDLEMDAGSRARFALHARAALNQEPGQ